MNNAEMNCVIDTSLLHNKTVLFDDEVYFISINDGELIINNIDGQSPDNEIAKSIVWLMVNQLITT